MAKASCTTHPTQQPPTKVRDGNRSEAPVEGEMYNQEIDKGEERYELEGKETVRLIKKKRSGGGKKQAVGVFRKCVGGVKPNIYSVKTKAK